MEYSILHFPGSVWSALELAQTLELQSVAVQVVDLQVDCYFLSFFFVVNASHRRSAQIKKLILQKLTEAPKNLVGRSWTPFQSLPAILGPLVSILDF